MKGRFVYIVSNRSYPKKDGVDNAPALGVHSSLRKANRHYDSILKDREYRGGCVEWENIDKSWRVNGDPVRECFITYGGGMPSGDKSEMVTISKWVIS